MKCQLGVQVSGIKAFAFGHRKQILRASSSASSITLDAKQYDMSKLYILAALLAVVSAAPAPAPAPGALLAAAPAIAAVPAPIVTASSSQYVARNYNTLAAAPLAAAAPFVAAAPLAAAPVATAARFAAAPFAAAAYAPLAYGTHAVAPAYSAAYSAPVLL
ncbi:cuticle protein 10.6-like [Harpegnathos saltator]|nr:cuticle protein 10.6-like [Harpegnathos saltator]